MFRGVPFFKLCLVRVSNKNLLLQKSVKCTSTMVPPVQHIKSTDEKTDDQLPPWVQSDLDRKIYTATDANVLLGTLKEEKFNSRTAANIIAALGKFVENGKLTASTFQSNPRKNILEDNLCSVKFQMNTFGILQVLDFVVFIISRT